MATHAEDGKVVRDCTPAEIHAKIQANMPVITAYADHLIVAAIKVLKAEKGDADRDDMVDALSSEGESAGEALYDTLYRMDEELRQPAKSELGSGSPPPSGWHKYTAKESKKKVEEAVYSVVKGIYDELKKEGKVASLGLGTAGSVGAVGLVGAGAASSGGVGRRGLLAGCVAVAGVVAIGGFAKDAWAGNHAMIDAVGNAAQGYAVGKGEVIERTIGAGSRG